MRRVLLASIALSAFVGCSVESEPLSSGGCLSLEVSLEGGEDSSSRIEVSEQSGSDSWSVEWSEGDLLGGVGLGGSQSSFSEFKMESFDAKNSTFSGAIQSEQLRLVYPFDSSSVIDDDSYRVDLTTQVADASDSFASLSSYTHMISSTPLDTNSAEAITMKHLGAAMTLNVAFSSLSDDYTYILGYMEIGQTESSESSIAIPTSYEIDLGASLDSSSIYSNAERGALTIEVENSPYLYNYDAAQSSTIYPLHFNIFPFDVANGEILDLTWHLYCKNNSTGVVREIFNTVEITNQSGSKVSFERSTHNVINALCDIEGCYMRVTIDVGFD